MTTQENIEAAEWLENDAAYLENKAAIYASKGDKWLADRVAANAKHSAKLANEYRQKNR